MTTSTVERLLVSRKEAAAMLGVSARTIDRMVAAGRLKPLRIGRLVRFPVEDLRRLARERQQ